MTKIHQFYQIMGMKKYKEKNPHHYRCKEDLIQKLQETYMKCLDSIRESVGSMRYLVVMHRYK